MTLEGFTCELNSKSGNDVFFSYFAFLLKFFVDRASIQGKKVELNIWINELNNSIEENTQVYYCDHQK